MKYTSRKIISTMFVLGSILFTTNLVSAKEYNQPTIESKTFPHGSSIKVTLPEGFSGKVLTSCDNGVCTSTSSPITDKEMKEMKDQMDKQQKEMEDFFKKQQEFFDKIFNLSNSWIFNW